MIASYLIDMVGDKSALQVKIENHYLRNSSIMEQHQWYIGFAMSADAIGSDLKGRTYFKCWENYEDADLNAIRSHFINNEKFLDAEFNYTTVNQKAVFIFQE